MCFGDNSTAQVSCQVPWKFKKGFAEVTFAEVIREVIRNNQGGSSCCARWYSMLYCDFGNSGEYFYLENGAGNAAASEPV